MDSSFAPTPAGRSSFLYVAVISLAAATGGLLFGFDTAVISGTQRFFEAEFALSEAMTGWVVSSALVGCMIGAGFAGMLSDRFGRKKVLILSAILFTLSAIGCGLARHTQHLVWARLVGGMGIGIASLLSPLYIAEVSPPRVRGRLVALQQLAIVTGILLAFFSNKLLLGTSLADPAKWRWMLAVAGFPSILFFLLLLPIPESPRWLVQQGLRERARGILRRIAGPAEADGELAQIEQAIAQETGTFSELLRPGLRVALLIGVVLAVLSQVTGINAIMYYAPRIFEASGAEASSAFNDTVFIGLINVVFTLISMVLVDRVGRKPLLIWGVVGMGVSLLLTSVAFAMKVSGPALLVPILAYVASFAVSTGVVVWVIISEIFPTRVRGRAMSIATVSLWAACYLVSQTFPILLARVGPAPTFLVYAAMCAVMVAFTWRIVPETKGRTLEEIERSWSAHGGAFPVLEVSSTDGRRA